MAHLAAIRVLYPTVASEDPVNVATYHIQNIWFEQLLSNDYNQQQIKLQENGGYPNLCDHQLHQATLFLKFLWS